MKRSLSAFLALALCGTVYAQGVPNFGSLGVPNGGPASGGGGGSGTVTNIATSCGVSGGPITTTGTISATLTARDNTATTDTLVTGDCGTVVTESNASAVAVAIAQAGTTGFAKGFYVTVKNKGAGLVTITPTTSTIDGSATLTLAQNASVDIYSDGTNYITLPGRSTGGVSSANPTATAGPAAVNGTAPTFLTSDSAPAVQKGTNAQFGLAEGDNTSISMAAGVVSTKAFTGNCTTAAGAVATVCDSPFPGYTANLWYLTLPAASLSTGATFTASQIYCRYHQFPQTVTITNVGLNVQTGGGGNIQIGFYTNNTSHLPGTLISNTPSISTTTTGNKSGALGAAIQLGPNGTGAGRDVWICVNSDNATHVMEAYSSANSAFAAYAGATSQNLLFAAGSNTTLDNISCSGANCNGGVSTFGTWPTLTGSTWAVGLTTSRFPVIEYQVTSSP